MSRWTSRATRILLVSQRPRGWRPDHPVTCSGSCCTLSTSDSGQYNASSSGIEPVHRASENVWSSSFRFFPRLFWMSLASVYDWTRGGVYLEAVERAAVVCPRRDPLVARRSGINGCTCADLFEPASVLHANASRDQDDSIERHSRGTGLRRPLALSRRAPDGSSARP
jgi:hypothetical protein